MAERETINYSFHKSGESSRLIDNRTGNPVASISGRGQFIASADALDFLNAVKGVGQSAVDVLREEANKAKS